MCFLLISSVNMLDGAIYAHPIKAPKGRHNLAGEQFINPRLVCSFDFGCFEMKVHFVLIFPATTVRFLRFGGTKSRIFYLHPQSSKKSDTCRCPSANSRGFILPTYINPLWTPKKSKISSKKDMCRAHPCCFCLAAPLSGQLGTKVGDPQGLPLLTGWGLGQVNRVGGPPFPQF